MNHSTGNRRRNAAAQRAVTDTCRIISLFIVAPFGVKILSFPIVSQKAAERKRRGIIGSPFT